MNFRHIIFDRHLRQRAARSQTDQDLNNVISLLRSVFFGVAVILQLCYALYLKSFRSAEQDMYIVTKSVKVY